MSRSDSVVSLNVGGHIYTTARSTLTRFRDSMLGAMFGGDFDTLRDDQGRYFIDRNGRLFEYVLNFLRTTQLVLPEDFKELPQLEIEADFYQIQPLIEALKSYKPRPRSEPPVPCEVVVLSIRRFGFNSGLPPIVEVSASSREVKDMVRYSGSGTGHDGMARMLRTLHNGGFIVESHVAFGSDQEKMVLVRKLVRNSSDSK
ncbi:BTB/POZ domain-containing protein KCTD6-like [Branchiostoma floridae]|nr:BTB/POZ domain-containing protein KCTD6-like [Branchiostoma floridae]